MNIKFLASILLLMSLLACQSHSGDGVEFDIPAKTGFRVWDIADPMVKGHIQGQVWYPVSAETQAIPAPLGYFRRSDQALEAPVADAGKKYPLVLIDDGRNFGPDAMAWLAEVLVANGYIVGSVRSEQSSDSANQLNYWNQPVEVKALLTSLLASELGSFIDQKKIGFIGYSGGALTGLWLAGAKSQSLEPEKLVPGKEEANQEAYGNIGKLLPTVDIAGWRASYRDPRIATFVLLAPSWTWVFDEQDLKNITSRIFIITGDDDENVSAAQNAIRLAQWIPGAAFKELQGHVGHWEFMGFWTREGVTALRSKLPEGALPSVPSEHRRRFVHDEVTGLTVEFLNRNLQAKS
ncbi:MAG: hypothetical protein E6Q59_00330 [Nitrosomonas sp.]|nr:MAG: hypothetical protein E6Q59_00330 [Nitrosomonas sp.]